MALPKFAKSTDFFQKCVKRSTQSFKKQVIFFFTLAFRPMIHNIYLRRYCLFTLLVFFIFVSLSF